MNLKLNEGIVKLNRFDGAVNIKINGGNVFCSQIKNANIDVNSNLGFVYSNLVVKNSSQKDNQFEYNHKGNLNKLFVNAVSANIHLKALEE